MIFAQICSELPQLAVHESLMKVAQVSSSMSSGSMHSSSGILRSSSRQRKCKRVRASPGPLTAFLWSVVGRPWMVLVSKAEVGPDDVRGEICWQWPGKDAFPWAELSYPETSCWWASNLGQSFRFWTMRRPGVLPRCSLSPAAWYCGPVEHHQ